MLILFFFIAIIPLAVTGIIVQLGYFSNIKPERRSTFYALTIILSSALFYLPLLLSLSFYFLWLFWVGLILGIAYFVVRQHRHELQTNPTSRYMGILMLLAILVGSLYVLYSQR